ncbi:MAG: hypothetical protein IKU93_06135 [Alistipes sp.]|nr:hypothetical protein [Alistipes sp.]
MRLLLINILMLVSIIGAQAQERWFRPVNVGTEEHKDVVINGDTIRYFKGEWLETVAKGKGDVIISGDTLPTDPLGLANHYQRTNSLDYVPLGLHFSADYDTIRVSYNDTAEIRCMVINQAGNAIVNREFIIPGELVIPVADSLTVLRFAPENRASETVDITAIEGYGVKPEPEPVTPDEPEPDYSIYIYIGIGVAVLLWGVLAFILFIRHKQKKLDESEPEEVDNTDIVQPINPQQSQKSNKKHNQQPQKQESIEEKVRRYESELASLRGSVKSLENEKTNLNNKLATANTKLSEAEAKVKTIKDEVKKEAEAEITKLKTNIDDIKKQSAEDIKSLKEQFDADNKRTQERIAELDTTLRNTETELSTTKSDLEMTKNSLETANNAIDNLNERLGKYNTILSDVPFAKEYAALVGKMVDVANEVRTSALKMLDLNVEDPYNLMRYITRYEKTVSLIDMATLMSELKMLEKGNMVLVGSTLATYNKSNSEEDLKSSTCQYFFTSYLQKMIDGLVVLNESMAAANRLVEGVTKDNVKVFSDYRPRIQELCSQLGIVVENVRLFDKVGEKIDLNAQLVDFGFATGDIIDMENALVYLEGSHRPETKVRVKVQE